MYVLSFLHLYTSFSERFLVKFSPKILPKITKKRTRNRPGGIRNRVWSFKNRVPEPIPLPEPCWIDFGWISAVLFAQLGAILGGKLGPCWDPKPIFTGVGRRPKMSTKLKAFRDRFWTDFGAIFNAKIQSKSFQNRSRERSRFKVAHHRFLPFLPMKTRMRLAEDQSKINQKSC